MIRPWRRLGPTLVAVWLWSMSPGTARGLEGVIAMETDDARLVTSETCRTAAGGRPTTAGASDDVPVVTAPGEQRSVAVTTDGAGGAIIAWEDRRHGGSDLFAQHVLANGQVDPAWPLNGVALCLSARSVFHHLVADGAGGAIVVWEDSLPSIRAQRVRSTGTLDPAWGPCGVTVANTPNTVFGFLLSATRDGAGGAFVTWRDGRLGSSNTDIFATHLIGSGLDAGWPVNGIPVCTAPLNQTGPLICSDGGNGAIVAWADRRTVANDYDIYAQHVRLDGTVDPSWPLNGANVVARAAGQRFYSTDNIFWIDWQSSDVQAEAVIPDGDGGCFIAWTDGNTPASQDIYVHHLLSSGSLDPAWTPGGVAACIASGPQGMAYLASDGAGGVVVTWADGRDGVDSNLYQDLYIQHLSPSGIAMGPPNGLAVLTGGTGRFPNQTTDGSGGVSIFWTDRRDSITAGTDAYVQHAVTDPSLAIDAAFPINGKPVSSVADDQDLPTAVWNGTVGAIVAWNDRRNFGITDWDIYASAIVKTTTDVAPRSPGVALGIASPNPFRDRMRIDFELPRAASVRLEMFDPSGRRVKTIVSGRLDAGRHEATWSGSDDQGRALPAGVYLVSLRANAFTATRRVFLIR